MKSPNNFPLCYVGRDIRHPEITHRKKRNSNGSLRGVMRMVRKKQSVKFQLSSWVSELSFLNGNVLSCPSHPSSKNFQVYLLSPLQICIVVSIAIFLVLDTFFSFKDISEHLLSTISTYISPLSHSPLFPLYSNHLQKICDYFILCVISFKQF